MIQKMNLETLVGFIFMILVSNSNAANLVTLKSRNNNKYVCAENAGKDSLLANRERAFIWETFEVINNNDGTISLKSPINNRYVCAEDGGNSPLIANRDAIGQWEKFNLIPVSSKSVFKSMANGKYVSVTDDGKLIASATTVGIREYFIISANLVTLKSIYNGLYVSADNSGNSPLVARPQKAYLWETYEMICHSDYTVSFKSLVNNLYVCTGTNAQDYLIASINATTDCTIFNVITNFTSNICAYKSIVNKKYVSVANNGQLIANASTIGIQETFAMSAVADNKLSLRNWVTLKSSNNSLYVSAENAGNDPLVANRNQAGVWEIFDLILNTDGTVSLMSCINARYVCAGNNSNLIAYCDANSEWKKFNIINVYNTNIVAFQSFVNGKYVTVASNGQLIANASTFGIQESFEISTFNFETTPQDELLVLLRVYPNFGYSMYLSADNAGNNRLIANKKIPAQTEKFMIRYYNDDTVSLFAYANNKYVCAQNAGRDYLVASSSEVGPWEKFKKVCLINTLICTFQSYVNGKYVTFGNNGALIANLSGIGWAQLFTLYNGYN